MAAMLVSLVGVVICMANLVMVRRYRRSRPSLKTPTMSLSIGEAMSAEEARAVRERWLREWTTSQRKRSGKVSG